MSLLWEQRVLFFFYMAARTVQRHDQFRAVEHSMLKILVERDGIVRAGIHTELAEHARTEVVLVLSNIFFFLAVFRFNHLAGHLDGVVGTSHLAQAASHAPMFIFVIMGHGQRATETVGEFQCRAVFRILFGSLSSQNTVMVVFIPVSREVTRV